MRITGANLQIVAEAVRDSIFWLNNEIATCPDVNYFAGELDDLEAEIDVREKLLARIRRAIDREGQNHTKGT